MQMREPLTNKRDLFVFSPPLCGTNLCWVLTFFRLFKYTLLCVRKFLFIFAFEICVNKTAKDRIFRLKLYVLQNCWKEITKKTDLNNGK